MHNNTTRESELNALYPEASTRGPGTRWPPPAPHLTLQVIGRGRLGFSVPAGDKEPQIMANAVKYEPQETGGVII